MVKTIFDLVKQDSTVNPRESDWKQFHEQLLKSYIHQPLIARKLIAMGSGQLIKLNFDGKRKWEATQLNDVDPPAYDFLPGVKDTNIDGQLIEAYLPQIYESVLFGKDELKQTFQGQARLPIVQNQIAKRIAIKEDQIVFYGVSAKKVYGFTSSSNGGTDLGNPTAAWGIDTGSNGILDNMRADIKKALDQFRTAGLGDRPVDMIVTSYIYNLIQTTLRVYGDSWASDYFKRMLNGGNILVSDYIQSATVSTTANTAVFIVRDPNGWALLSSGLEYEQEKNGLWAWRYGVREKFSVKVLNTSYIAWMDGISVALA